MNGFFGAFFDFCCGCIALVKPLDVCMKVCNNKRQLNNPCYVWLCVFACMCDVRWKYGHGSARCRWNQSWTSMFMRVGMKMVGWNKHVAVWKTRRNLYHCSRNHTKKQKQTYICKRTHFGFCLKLKTNKTKSICIIGFQHVDHVFMVF